MRHIFVGMGTFALGLATMTSATDPVGAQRGGRAGGGGGGHVTAGRAVVRTGSVHYGASSAPVRIATPVREATVRSEHYAGPAYGGAYRNPYGAAYFGHFRPGYRPYMLGDAQYYGYDALPLGYQQIALNGIVYYLFDGVYYQAYMYEGQTVYLAVPVPV
jgi:hypothetical protein